jgi:hypothetical protein
MNTTELAMVAAFGLPFAIFWLGVLYGLGEIFLEKLTGGQD